MKKITIFSVIIACVILSIVIYGCSTSEPPLHIRDIRVSPQPAVGKTVTMDVEVENRYQQDYDNIIFELMPSSGIQIVDGQTSQTITIKQGERKTISIPICVTQEGEQEIRLWVSIPISEQSRMTDRDTIHITIYGTNSYVAQGKDYFSLAPTPPGYQLPEPSSITCEGSAS